MSIAPSLPLLGREALEAGIRAGNINIAGQTKVEVMDLNDESRAAQAQHQDILRRFEAQRRSRAIVVPTAVEEVKQMLREMGHPVTLFGENPMDRRDRLREVIAAMELSEEDAGKMQQAINQRGAAEGAGGAPDRGKAQKEIYYTHASEELIEARKAIASYSFSCAQQRMALLKKTRESDELQTAEDTAAWHLYNHNKDLILSASIVGDDRPLSCIRQNKSGTLSASGSYNPLVKLWDNQTQAAAGVLRSHEERITSVAWGPQTGGFENLIATSAADKTCKLWDISNYDKSTGDLTTCRTFSGHLGTVADCSFHPSGRYLGTASHDFTWRLWDIETNSQLLLQDGHINECSVISFHNDGSLVLTADHAGVVHIWDLRSGQSIMCLQGHMKKIVSGSFSPSGFQAATCGIDNQARIWDLRSKKCGYILPAHSNVITDLSFSRSGELLATSSFDGSIKVWGTRDFRLLNTLTGHAGKVMACDFGSDERRLVSAGFDRTVKYWAHKNEF